MFPLQVQLLQRPLPHPECQLLLQLFPVEIPLWTASSAVSSVDWDLAKKRNPPKAAAKRETLKESITTDHNCDKLFNASPNHPPTHTYIGYN